LLTGLRGANVVNTGTELRPVVKKPVRRAGLGGLLLVALAVTALAWSGVSIADVLAAVFH